MPLLDLQELCSLPPNSAATWGSTRRTRMPRDAAEDLCAVSRAHVEAFQAWMTETRSASTALNKHKGLQQFFKWLLVDEQAIDRSPMERVRQPKTPRKLIPVVRDEDTGRLLDACKGKSFANLRDETLIRLYCNTGARLSEVGNLLVPRLTSTPSRCASVLGWPDGLRSALYK
ncbi:tyrosine-type recombinase/integrase [Micromonospora sp. NPDC051141]|uniref:tyrosine-type recombinase/integrase n=1 Tax=Micromonospora sp. NPDC051141 TaxID=3364284 RepID=UPI0037B4EE9C